MKRIGNALPSFRAPALVAGTLTYLGSVQFPGRWTALCFLPYVSIVEPDFIDRQATSLDRLDTTLLIVSSGTRPLHRVWMDRPTTPRTPLLYDPLSRLHRTFGVPPTQIPARCQTFLIDRAGILRFHLIHDFTDRGLAALHEIATMSQAQDTSGSAVSGLEADARPVTVNAEPHLVSLQPSSTEG
jgi:alkyl hydroperoxide reductase subunit AhpC